LHSVAILHPQPHQQATGFDEGLYREYATKLGKAGLLYYPEIMQDYVERQERASRAFLPPVRFLYIFSGYAWSALFKTPPLEALRDVASFFNILTLVVATLFAARATHLTFAVGIAALMAVAPTQIHMSQHALIDGFFTFWAMLALWALWENLQAPRSWPWLAAYTAVLAALVLTKENAFFVWLAFVAVLIANRWLKFGVVRRELLAATIIGPALGVLVLVLLAGGVTPLLHLYRVFVAKNMQLQYAILTGDGPWHRYLVDSMLVSPIVVILAIGAVFRANRATRIELFLLVFVGVSYVAMCNVRYGMNLRYANMWDLPLRILALRQLIIVAGAFGRYAGVALLVAVVGLCAVEFRQYLILAVQYPLYELIPMDLLRALRILKFPADLTPPL
jgi:4-amino-4-deoxy-L-arabinose transferase-like glycosyltransferase